MLIRITEWINKEEKNGILNQNKNYCKSLFDTVQSKTINFYNSLIDLISNLTCESTKTRSCSKRKQ